MWWPNVLWKCEKKFPEMATNCCKKSVASSGSSCYWLKLVVQLCLLTSASANPDAKRLYDDLLSNYNRLIRPVSNHTDKVTVKLGVRLSQLVDLVSDITINTPILWHPNTLLVVLVAFIHDQQKKRAKKEN